MKALVINIVQKFLTIMKITEYKKFTNKKHLNTDYQYFTFFVFSKSLQKLKVFRPENPLFYRCFKQLFSLSNFL